MPDIFISHATKDDALVTKIHDELKVTGLDFWVDHLRLTPPESNWRTAIHQGLQDSAGGVLLLLSRNTVKRPEIDGEWTYCLSIDRPLYIAKIDDVPALDINPRLHIVQWIDLTQDWERGMAALAAVLQGKPLPPAAPVIQTVKLTGDIERRLTQTPLRGRDADVATLKNALKSAPTVIIGVGGLGKSKLAAEVALTGDTWQGVIWQRLNEYTQPYDVIDLVKQHFELPPATDRPDVLAKLKTRKTLVVLDNAEDVPPTDPRHPEFVRLVNDLLKHSAQVLLTSRVEWEALNPVRTHEPAPLADAAARQLVLDLGAAYGVKNLEEQADAIAVAARKHPRLIEFAIGQMKRFPAAKILLELRELTSRKVQDAMDEMIQKTLRQMVVTDEFGTQAEALLKRLVVCRGGFTLDAAAKISGMDSDDLDVALTTLQIWQFVTYNSATERYELPPMVIAALPPDTSAHRPHFDYYDALAQQHEESADHEKYFKLDVESDNLEAAFEWAMTADEYEQAYWLYNACSSLLANRGRFEQRKNWLERVAAAINSANSGDLADRLKAVVQNSLGNLYRQYPLGDRHANLQQAVAAYEAALVYRTPQSAPLDYATTQNNLGAAYSDLAAIEDREANLKRAVAAYEAALVYRTPQSAPLSYAMTQNNLGAAYADLAAIADREANLKRAVAAFEAALVYRTPQSAPLDYAMTQNNLGIAYQNLAAIADREANLTQAVAAYEAALVYQTPQSAPLDYAMTQNNLGTAYRNLSEIADREANLKRAVTAYEAALVYWTPQSAPLYYAATQNNLGNAYADLAAISDQAGNLQRAVAAYEAALVYWTPQSAPLHYAMTQNNLGIAYSDLAAIEDREANLKRAVAAYEAALVYYTPQSAPLHYAMTQENVGLLYRDLAKLEDREKNLHIAVNAYKEALRFLTPEAAPYNHAKAQRGLGILYEDLGDLPAAIACWREAERYYRQMGQVQDADKMLRWIAAAEQPSPDHPSSD